MEKLNDSTVINARQAFLGQEPLTTESALDAIGFLDLDVTTATLFDRPAVLRALQAEMRASAQTKSRNTEYFIAARQVVKMWVYSAQ